MQQNENERQLALNELGLINTAPSESFDRITRMASQIFGTPIAAVSLTDEDRQWFKSRVGCGAEIPRDKAPCAEVTRIADVVVVSDLSRDTRFAGGTLVRDGIRFYAGAPLTTRDGFTLGAFCILDTKPRTLTADETRLLIDLAAMVMAQVELQHAFGRIDPSSGLPNRHQFSQDFDDMARDNAGQDRVAMLVDAAGPLELSQAMRILGPSHLDGIVQGAARAIKERLPAGTALYHIGITQFAAILPGQSAQALYARVLNHFDEMADDLRSDKRAGIVPVVGLMPFRLGDVTAAQVLRAIHGAAQDARYAEKPVSFYSAALDDTHRRRYSIISSLQDALDASDQLSLHYQPRIDMQTGRCDGAEALLRWRHPALGDVSPGEFIPLAEATGSARFLTEWVIDAALRQASAWHASGLSIKVSINVSPSDLEDADFAERLADGLKRHAVQAELVEIEFTEGGLIRYQSRILASMAAIQALGVVCAIDDFGTGYSSFSYLKNIPAKVIKIDQSFIRDLAPGGPDGALVRGMIGMAHELGLWVVGEGVETQLAYDFLRNAGCDEAQGYLISRPVPPDAFTAWLRSRHVDRRNDAAA